MPEESKVVDTKVDEEAATEVVHPGESTNDDDVDDANIDAIAASSSTKKKKSKKAKLKKALGAGNGEDGDKNASGGSSNPASKLTSGMVEQLLEMNPSLNSEVAGMDKTKATETLKKLDVADLLTGMVCPIE